MRAPSRTPALSWMLNDIPASDRQIARYLGVTVQTLKKYRKTDKAPRAVYMAIFWETNWGRSALYSDAVNGEMYARNYAQSLEKKVSELREHISLLERELEISRSGGSAANLPIFKVF